MNRKSNMSSIEFPFDGLELDKFRNVDNDDIFVNVSSGVTVSVIFLFFDIFSYKTKFILTSIVLSFD